MEIDDLAKRCTFINAHAGYLQLKKGVEQLHYGWIGSQFVFLHDIIGNAGSQQPNSVLRLTRHNEKLNDFVEFVETEFEEMAKNSSELKDSQKYETIDVLELLFSEQTVITVETMAELLDRYCPGCHQTYEFLCKVKENMDCSWLEHPGSQFSCQVLQLT